MCAPRQLLPRNLPVYLANCHQLNLITYILASILCFSVASGYDKLYDFTILFLFISFIYLIIV